MKALNRKAIRQQIDRLKAEGDAEVQAARKAMAEAEEAFAKYEEPRRKFQEASQAVHNATTRLDNAIGRLELELRKDAEATLDRSREMLQNMFQQTRGAFDAAAGNGKAVSARLAAIRDAIAQLDALYVSGEDLKEGVKRIVASLPAVDPDTFDVRQERNREFAVLAGIGE